MIIVATGREALDRVGRFTDVGEGQDPDSALSGHDFTVRGGLDVDEQNMTIDFKAQDDLTGNVYDYTVRVDRIPKSFSEMFDGSCSWLAIDAEEWVD